MDYFSLAEQMLSVRARLSHLPAGEAISDACGGEFFALSLLLLDDAPGCPSGLRRSMGVSSARIAALLKHLEQKGWISRSADEHDERRVNVSLTDAGRELINSRRRAGPTSPPPSPGATLKPPAAAWRSRGPRRHCARSARRMRTNTSGFSRKCSTRFPKIPSIDKSAYGFGKRSLL